MNAEQVYILNFTIVVLSISFFIRWTVRADCLKSVLNNYSELLHLWDVCIEDGIADSEMKARIMGVQSQMKKFSFLMCMYIYKC